jgi:hypothetical protein
MECAFCSALHLGDQLVSWSERIFDTELHRAT